MNTLLVVDDERAFADFIVKVAETAGYEATACDTVASFRRATEKDWPSVLVLDLQMPDTDGIALLRELGERRCTSKVMLISAADGRVMDAAYRLGGEFQLAMAGMMHKPVRAAVLRELLAASGAGAEKLTAGALADAIDNDRLFLLYQPKIDVATGRVVGAEALVRWRDGAGRVIPPDSFIGLAETSGLIDRLTVWVVDGALRQMGEWRRGNLDLRVAINLSAASLHDRDLPDLLAARCAAAGVPADRVVLELTETASMQESASVLEVLGRFRLKGFHLSIDDFGTGYSSVARLLRLPFSELKVDKSFVSVMAGTREAAVVTKALVDLAHNLGLSAVAEGVESGAVLAMLEQWGCDVAQGFFFSPPVDAAVVETMARAPAWRP